MTIRGWSYPWLALAALGLLCGCQAPRDGGRVGEANQLQGSSSSFAAQAYWRWFNQLAVRQDINAELTVMGSGDSIRAFLADRVDFAGTDSAPTAAEIKASRRGLLAFPVTAGAIAVAYNLPGCNLRLTRAQLVAVFLGQIRDFQALGCQPQPIRLFHRAEASGATASITATLASFSPLWRGGPGVGRQVRWPLGEAVTGSDGMAEALQVTPGGFGYVEAAFVRAPLQAAALQTRTGEFQRPTPAAAAEGLSQIRLDGRLLGQNPDPVRGYPIVNLNWMLVPRQGLQARADLLRTSLRYILSQAGQDDAELLGYVPLPVSLRERSLGQLSQIRR